MQIDGNKMITTSKYFVIYYKKNELDHYRFGISVGKKVGNAVVRNKVKRQLKAIISQKDYQNNFNCIIIVGKGIINRSFEERKNNLIIALNNLNLIKENINEEK